MRKFIILVTIISVLCMMSAGFAQEAKSSKFQYIGVKKCKMCHKGEKKGNIFEKWQQRGHANAYAQLASEKSKEVAKKAGVKGDPQQAKQCLSCHITGYLASADQKTETLTMEEGVSCEACHGAGSGYKSLKIMKDLNAGKLKGADYGLVNLSEKYQLFLKAVIPNEVRNLIFTKILDLQISPFGRNDTKLFPRQTLISVRLEGNAGNPVCGKLFVTQILTVIYFF